MRMWKKRPDKLYEMTEACLMWMELCYWAIVFEGEE